MFKITNISKYVKSLKNVSNIYEQSNHSYRFNKYIENINLNTVLATRNPHNFAECGEHVRRERLVANRRDYSRNTRDIMSRNLINTN